MGGAGQALDLHVHHAVGDVGPEEIVVRALLNAGLQAILSIVMVRSLGCVWSSQPEPTSIRTMTAFPAGAPVDALGKRFVASLPSGRPTASLRATTPLLLLHHVLGRQLGSLQPR